MTTQCKMKNSNKRAVPELLTFFHVQLNSNPFLSVYKPLQFAEQIYQILLWFYNRNLWYNLDPS